MTFWIRHLTLLILCVVVPLGAALYVDTETEKARAQRSGATAARLAANTLAQRLRLDAHQAVGEAMLLARKITDEKIEDDLRWGGRRRETGIEKLAKMLAPSADGFGWMINEKGEVVFANGMTELSESPRLIAGHPLFRKTQQGFAVDGFWEENGKLSMVGAAPIVNDGRAEGAVFIARKVDAQLLTSLVDIGELTVAVGDQLVATTVEESFAKNLVEQTRSSAEPVSGGKLEQPLASGTLAFLPLLIDPHADGFAFTSFGQAAPSGGVRWIVSVPSAAPLQDLARRQEILLGVLAASLMLALLVGLLNHRTFVSPITRVAEHLSAIQLGRGEIELNESKVSRPFRRLVRLINMMMQKMPARAFSSGASMAETSPISELPHPVNGDLDLGPPLRAEIRPPPKTLSPLPTLEPEEFEPADINTFPPSRVPMAVFSGHEEEENAAVAEAIASMGLPPVHPSEMDGEDGEEDSASAIAEAIASLEAQQRAAADAGLIAPSSPKSASSIRGSVPQHAIESPFTPSQSEFFREGKQTAARPSQIPKAYMPSDESVTASVGVRGGGSLNLGAAALADENAFQPEETVVAPVQEELLAKTARDELTGEHEMLESAKPDATVVASVPADLLAQSAGEAMPEGPSTGDLHGLDAADHAHFKQVYERFIDMRRKCGEATADLAFDRFLTKLTKNRENLIKKYNCRTVRFQVYEKDGKAALKATPVRAR